MTLTILCVVSLLAVSGLVGWNMASRPRFARGRGKAPREASALARDLVLIHGGLADADSRRSGSNDASSSPAATGARPMECTCQSGMACSECG